jgi:hypothetical protein
MYLPPRPAIEPPHYPKPPLGLMPRWRWLELRREELKQAILRYMDAGRVIPAEWLNEYSQLGGELWRERRGDEMPETKSI